MKHTFNFNKQKKIVDAIVRVNHAGEYAAVYMYLGQLHAINRKIVLTKRHEGFQNCLQNSEIVEHIEQMLEVEKRHLLFFQEELKKRNMNPTVFLPLWRWLSYYILGCLSLNIGVRSGMLATSAVEEVIERHYQKQIRVLSDLDKVEEIRDNIITFCKEEVEHKISADNYVAHHHADDKKITISRIIAESIYTLTIKSACKFAILVSKLI